MTVAYSARVFYTIPTVPPTHTMSAAIATPEALAQFTQALDATTWTYSAVEYHGDWCDETGAPHEPDYDFHCYQENSCPACGGQIESDSTPSPMGGYDDNEWCPNGCRLLRTPGGTLQATRLGMAW